MKQITTVRVRMLQSILTFFVLNIENGRTDNDLKRGKIPRVTHGTDLSQRGHM